MKKATETNTEKIFNKLKKQNGEKFAQAIRGDRDHDGNLLIIPNILHILEFAGHDENEARKLRPILKEIYLTKTENQYQTDQDPLELLNAAGYDAFVVTNEEQKNSIKKYYRPGEEICTLRDPHRHENYYMIHAIKRGADKIQPSNHPEREDEYGTSVISIQIAKNGGFISIKNRYNHTISDPDATFGNNPDNIILGLSESLKRYFQVDFNTSKNLLPYNFRIVNDQFVRYNYEVDNVYFASNYYFSGSTITKIDKNHQIMMDCFVLDTKTSELISPVGENVGGYNTLRAVFNNKKIKIEDNPKNKKEKIIFADGKKVAIISNGQIVELNLPNITTIENDFLSYNNTIRLLSLPNVIKIGSGFLLQNTNLEELNLPVVQEVGTNFLSNDAGLCKINLPNCTKIDDNFLLNNERLYELNLPILKKIGSNFLGYNKRLRTINLPNVENIGHNFLSDNMMISLVNMPKVKEIGDSFLSNTKYLQKISLPNVEHIGNNFGVNMPLIELELPNVISIGSYFLNNNNTLSSVRLPKAESIKHNFLTCDEKLTELYLPNVTEIGDDSLWHSHKLAYIYLPKAKTCGRLSLPQPELEYFFAPNLSDQLSKEFMDSSKQDFSIVFRLATQRINKRIDEMAEQASRKIDENIERVTKQIMIQPQDLEIRK
ncbi:MAG: leucine-rich repeat protein [Alphaproteobacteria bacterium]|nr:leucine-rich repeat protein [Alphaproteobacteria bacterium]